MSSFQGQPFDLIAFVEGDVSQLQKWHIIARETDTRQIPDEGYRALKNAQFPSKLKDDRGEEVLDAYRWQTALLLKYAVYLATRVTHISIRTERAM